MIVELCGLPGCGKTTLVSELKKAYPNFEIYTRNEIVGNNILFYKVIHRAIGITADKIYPAGYYEKAKACLDFLSEYDSRDKRFMYKMLEQDRALRLNKSKNIILDEGLFQGITSLPYDKIIDNRDTLDKALCKVFDGELDYKVVRCKLQTDIIIERIRKRNRQDRYSNPDDAVLKELLDVKEKNTDIVFEKMNDVNVMTATLDMGQDILDNIKKIYEIFN